MEKSKSSRLILFLFIFTVIALVGMAIWNGSAAQPTESALAALESDDLFRVDVTDKLIHFFPADKASMTAMIFYPGGGVDFRAYAPVLRRVAAMGFHVFVPSMPLNLSILDGNAADDIILAHPEIVRWFIAGHSLGGVSAASYAAGSSEVEGLILWAAYSSGNDLKNASLPVLSIYGTLDGLSTPEEIEASRENLPAGTIFLAIKGGNHAQFGDYGPQAGDNPADISLEAQHAQIAHSTAAFMARVTE